MCLSYTGLKSLPRLQAFHPPAERIREARDKFADRGDIAQNGFDHLPNLPGEVGECQQAGDHKKMLENKFDEPLPQRRGSEMPLDALKQALDAKQGGGGIFGRRLFGHGRSNTEAA